MPNLTVIEGNRSQRDNHGEAARQHLASLIVEILRAVARGDDRQFRLQDKLVSFCGEVSQSNALLATIIQDAVQAAHKNAVDLHSEKMSDYESEMRSIVQSALQVAAETMCRDSCARARASRRKEELRASIEMHLSERQRRERIRNGTEPYNPWDHI